MKILHKRLVKIILLSMVAALSISAVWVAAYAAGFANGSEPSSQKITETISSAAEGERVVAKEETVYVLANADGSAKKVIVSDWLKNPDGAASLSNYTDLGDINMSRAVKPIR